MKREGRCLPSSAGCLVVRKDYLTPAEGLAHLLTTLVECHKLDNLDVQNYGTGQPTRVCTVAAMLKRFHERKQNVSLRRIDKSLPENCLSISRDLGSHIPRPECTNILDYNLLDTLTRKIR